MKILQKATLAAAIAAAPFLAANAMQPMDDAFLSDVTGQAGVTIETSVAGQDATTIGSITYTDTDGVATATGGSLVIQGANGTGNGISVSGGTWDQATETFTYGGSFDRQTIDIDENGNLITKTVAINGFGGSVISETAKQIKIGEVLLRADGQTAGGAQLASNLEMVQLSGESSAHILNLSNGQYDLTSGNTNSVTHTVDGQAISLDNLKGQGANIAIVTKSSSRIANLNVDALDGAVGVRNMSYGGGANGDQLMESTQVIWAVQGQGAGVDGIYIQGSDSVGTLKIGELHLGGSNIGSIKITDIAQSGSITHIYGH